MIYLTQRREGAKNAESVKKFWSRSKLKNRQQQDAMKNSRTETGLLSRDDALHAAFLCALCISVSLR
jgi:hypothetical protein